VLYMQAHGFDLETICVKFGDYYRTAHQDGKWLPSR
jgi:hypothetical protein